MIIIIGLTFLKINLGQSYGIVEFNVPLDSI